MVLGDRSFDEGLGVECHPAVFCFPLSGQRCWAPEAADSGHTVEGG
jgi:hypothetical protein